MVVRVQLCVTLQSTCHLCISNSLIQPQRRVLLPNRPNVWLWLFPFQSCYDSLKFGHVVLDLELDFEFRFMRLSFNNFHLDCNLRLQTVYSVFSLFWRITVFDSKYTNIILFFLLIWSCPFILVSLCFHPLLPQHPRCALMSILSTAGLGQVHSLLPAIVCHTHNKFHHMTQHRAWKRE